MSQAVLNELNAKIAEQAAKVERLARQFADLQELVNAALEALKREPRARR